MTMVFWMGILLKLVRVCIGVEFDDGFWKRIRQHLASLNQSRHTVRNKVQHARRFYYVLQTRDARDLLCLSKEVRSHAMKSLSSLAKYLGAYDVWLGMVKRFS